MNPRSDIHDRLAASLREARKARLLLLHCRLPAWVCLGVCAAVEVGFNVYPSTVQSSLLLQAAHVFLLVRLYVAPAPLALLRRDSAAAKSQ